MAHPQMLEQREKKDASTQTTDRDFFLLEQTRDASTQTSDGNIFLLQHTRDASTQTIEELIFLETTTDESTHTSDEGFGILEEIHLNANNVNVSLDTIQQNRKWKGLEYIQKISSNQQFVSETKNTAICLPCNKTISEHVKVLEGANVYSCCQCNFKIKEEYILLKHISEHYLPTKPFYCNVCKVRYSYLDLHGNGEMCNVCQLNFQCKFQLQDHYLSHEERHLTYCRNCQEKIEKHETRRDEKKFYQCCMCEYESNRLSMILSHFYIHSSLKLYKCNVCGRRFKTKYALNSHFKMHS